MELGVIIGTEEEEFKKVADLGIPTIQMWIYCDKDNLTDEHAERVKEYCKKYEYPHFSGVVPLAWQCGLESVRGSANFGLRVPAATRDRRVQSMLIGSDFAKKLEIEDIITHVGFLPENPMTTEYWDVVTALREVAEHCKRNGQYFMFETGQETPVTLLRTIEDIGTGNLGVNLDPANLYRYGKGNPIDALDVFGKYVRGVHIKDASSPTEGRTLGPELPIGQGDVNFPSLFG